MQPGSLVELVKDNWKVKDEKWFEVITFPVKREIYTVREIIRSSGGVGLRLEEIVNHQFQFADGFSEPCFDIDNFRELQPPMDLSELIENSTLHLI